MISRHEANWAGGLLAAWSILGSIAILVGVFLAAATLLSWLAAVMA